MSVGAPFIYKLVPAASWQQAELLGRMLPHYAATALPVLILLAGLVGLIELGYALLTGDAGVGAGDTATKVLGMQLQLGTPGPWLTALAVTGIGIVLTRWIGGRLRSEWNATLATLHGDRA